MIKALPRFLTKIARGTKSCKKLTTLFPYSIDSSFLALGPHWKECADIIGPNKNEVHLQTSYPILRAIFFSCSYFPAAATLRRRQGKSALNSIAQVKVFLKWMQYVNENGNHQNIPLISRRKIMAVQNSCLQQH